MSSFLCDFLTKHTVGILASWTDILNSLSLSLSLSLSQSLCLSVSLSLTFAMTDTRVVEVVLQGSEEFGITLGEADVQEIIQHLDSEFRGCILAKDLIAFVDSFAQQR